MNPTNWQQIHFIGIGGVGMSGIAHILLDWGIKVSGSDAVDSNMFQSLLTRGANIKIGENSQALSNADMVIYSSAINANNPELILAQKMGITTKQRGQFLAQIATHFKYVISISGSHGKTSTSAILAYILRDNGINAGYLVGGEINDLPRSACAGDNSILVTEVDESDATQAYMKSTHAIILNIEDDHCWNVGGIEKLEQCFITFANNSKKVLAWNTPKTKNLLQNHPNITFIDDNFIDNNLQLQIPGKHNQTNATIAIQMATKFSIPKNKAILSANKFAGVSRRMSIRYKTPDNNIILIEDYAHHPTEVDTTITGIKTKYPNHQLLTIFQPHRFERIKRYSKQFSQVLSKSDQVIVYRPFAAWVDDTNTADPAQIAKNITNIPTQYYDGKLETLATQITPQNNQKLIILILGAGDITKLIPHLKNQLANTYLNNLQTTLTKKFPQQTFSRQQTWANLTSLKIGQAHPLVANPETYNQLQNLIIHCNKHSIPTQPIGAGTNILGTDLNYPKLIIKPTQGKFVQYKKENKYIIAGANIKLNKLIRNLAKENLLPIQAAGLASIPGTLAGAVKMNAGAFNCEIGDFVTKITAIKTDGTPYQATKQQIKWQYRKTSLPKNLIITQITLQFPINDNQKAEKKIKELGMKRHLNQPTGHSAGCTFRNPKPQSAGYLLEKANCKKMTIGDCYISEQHANFFINKQNASEEQFLKLILQAQKQIFKQTNIILYPEIIIIGDDANKKLQQQIKYLQDYQNS